MSSQRIATNQLIAMSDAGYHALEREVVARAGGHVVEDRGLLFVASARQPTPVIVNGVIRLDAAVPAQSTIDRAREWASQFGRVAGISTHARDADLAEALAAADWHRPVELPGMVTVERIMPVDPRPGVRLAPVQGDDGRRTLIAVLGESFGPDEPWPSLWADVFNDLSTINRPDTAAVLAYVDGQPAAAAVAYALDPVAVVGMVGTIARFGRRGLGNLVTRHVSAAVQELTGGPVVLQSSPEARPLYERIGFRAVTSYGAWVDNAKPH